MIDLNLIEILNILLSQPPQIPLLGCTRSCLLQIASNRKQVLKTFNHLTDILNNPEHMIADNISFQMMNATIFIVKKRLEVI